MLKQIDKSVNNLPIKGAILAPETFSGKTSQFTLCNLGAEEVKGAAVCLANAFMKEAIVDGLKISWDDFYKFSELFCKKTAADNLSVVAKDAKGDIVGTVVNEDMTPILSALTEHLQENVEIDPLQLLPAGIECFLDHEKFIPVFEILDTIEMQYAQHRIANNDTSKCLHFFMGAVEERAQSERLLYKMAHRAHRQVENCDFVYSVAECTNYFSQVVLEKLGGELITEVVYDEFAIAQNGKTIKPFAGVNEEFTKQRNAVAKIRHESKQSGKPFNELENCAYSLALMQVSIEKAMQIYNDSKN